jgi:hypothetical protein
MSMRVTEYIRRHHIGLIALFVAMTGTAYAGTQVVGHPTNAQTLKAKKKKAKQGPQGPKGDPGQPGNPAASINTGVITTPRDGTFYGTPSGASTASGTESEVQSLTPAGASITARDLSVSLPTLVSLPVSDHAIVTIRVNGADTALTCSVPVGGNACQNSSNAVTIPPNARFSMHIEVGGFSGTFSTERWDFGWRAVP